MSELDRDQLIEQVKREDEIVAVQTLSNELHLILEGHEPLLDYVEEQTTNPTFPNMEIWQTQPKMGTAVVLQRLQNIAYLHAQINTAYDKYEDLYGIYTFLDWVIKNLNPNETHQTILISTSRMELYKTDLKTLDSRLENLINNS